ncbi:MAG TPA: MarR family transcriptional regulator [Propionibacteriaceae bacterium]|nr:MarR family transcriptional regulator [Propionibacteriaceae bacterium]HPZ50157.1 MarR family transcriptional regulator [Propionibacteriaceae bacterium]HQE32448.1 MarR family transcriptional regulator [Propionibacteriaceae bacterium]
MAEQTAAADEVTGLVRALHHLLNTTASASTMDAGMVASGFPLVGDQPAFLLLHHLAHGGPTTPSHAADMLRTGRSNLSKIAMRLETAGLLVRTRDPQDERQIRLELTPQGQQIGDRLVALSVDHMGRALQQWPARDVTDLRRLLLALGSAMTEVKPRS